ncbi:Glucose-6-phosphate 1-dehydrogenase 4 chloroplastic [Zea mays]|uniref:Glucose-6-phosphate 1-dehydrogenase 4 chloroplastic n=1 Tax=Zea mays TaxID=4577 RepID=A0A1D6PBP4_MAIZE|nr:Glucose-6-phosphate 1-dehydrogenase 4 chloroplastic [Zea mays]
MPWEQPRPGCKGTDVAAHQSYGLSYREFQTSSGDSHPNRRILAVHMAMDQDENGQSGAMVPASNSSDRSDRSDKPMDQKVLRRLAQNREAARKSRLRKKAYVQQLESSKLKLASLEQELQKARQQGIFISSSGDQTHTMSGNGAMTFDLEYSRWQEEQNKQINELRTAVNAHASDSDLRLIVDGIMAHYDEIFRLKGIAAKADVFHILSGMWKTSAERCFLWLGGFRSSELLKLLVNQLEPLTEQQLMGLSNLQQSSQQAEDALSQGMEALQQSLAETLAGSLGPSGSSGNVANYMGQMAMAMGKLGTLENFLRQVARPAPSFRTQACGLRCWIAAKLKLRKALKRHHGWQLQRNLDARGNDNVPDCLEAASLTEKRSHWNMHLAYDSGGEMANTSSDTLDSSTVQEKPVVPGHIISEISSHVQKEESAVSKRRSNNEPSLCIAVIGATGELARTKVFPALFALYYSGFLPRNVGIFGYSRKKLTDEGLRSIIEANLTCRVDHQYGIGAANRIFYLAVPQEALLDVALPLADGAQTKQGWNRIIIEKPFGFTGLSSLRVTQSMLSRFEEKQIYRIDHLLGKDLIENLTVLRFSNLVFEPLWSRTYIRNVQVIFSEETSNEIQGRYFGNYGIIRDIVHSHILQTIALFAMEPPVSLDGEDIRDEKVKVLRSIRKVNLDDVVLGQLKDMSAFARLPHFYERILPVFIEKNYRLTNRSSITEVVQSLISFRAEIRIQFRHVPGNIYRERFGHDIDLDTNELVLRDQPEEAILLKVNNKVPGLGLQLDASELNLLYRDRYNTEVPDSYEHLLLDVLDGDSHLFMRSDELAAAWNVLTPIIHEIDQNRVVPELYEAGDRGPINAYHLAAKHGVRWDDDW